MIPMNVAQKKLLHHFSSNVSIDIIEDHWQVKGRHNVREYKYLLKLHIEQTRDIVSVIVDLISPAANTISTLTISITCFWFQFHASRYNNTITGH